MPEVIKAHWSTSEVAKAMGISPSLVRTWVSYLNWEVRRNAEGHRVFAGEDVEQLKALKDWLDQGNSLKEYRRERHGEGPYDPRIELRAAHKRLKELQTQQEALVAKQAELLGQFTQQRDAMQGQLLEIAGAIPAEGNEGDGPQGVLKQLLVSILEKRGKMQLLRRFEEDGKAFLEYGAPGGKKQVVQDVCTAEADRRLLETVLAVILNG